MNGFLFPDQVYDEKECNQNIVAGLSEKFQ